MASLRLFIVNSAVRNAVRINSNNVNIIIHRWKHVFLKPSTVRVIYQTSPRLPSLLQHASLYRFEHTSASDNNLTSAKSAVNNSQSIQSTSSSSSHKEAVDSATHSIEPKEVEAVSIVQNVDSVKGTFDFNESSLPPIPIPGDGTFESLAEPTLESLGLAGWSPSGRIQAVLEFFHVHFDLPWWAAIVGLTLSVRILMLPLSFKMKRDMVYYQNNMPQFQILQKQLSDARMSGDYFAAAQAAQELSNFMQNKKLIGFGMFGPYLIQFPVFLSVYFALRKMANTPDLLSFQQGGILWFTDLSLPDQYYILPLLTSLTLWATIKANLTAGAHPLNKFQANMVKVIQHGLPLLTFTFIVKFPAGILCYWTTTNIFVLVQNVLLSLEPIRKYLKIPKIIRSPLPYDSATSGEKKNFFQSFKDSYTNSKIACEIEDRERLNSARFDKLSSSPVPRTFKFDPTKANVQIHNLVRHKEKQ